MRIILALLKIDIAILSGITSFDLAVKIAKDLKKTEQIVPVEFRLFHGTESTAIINRNLQGKYCIVIQSTYPPVDRHLIQTLMIIKKCTDDGALGVSAVIPYMAYARQDRAFSEGEIASIALVAKLFEGVGTSKIITVDIHSLRALSYFTVDIRSISSIPLLANYAIKRMRLTMPIVISPDSGGIKRAQEFANILRTDMGALNKSRDKTTGEVTINEKLDFDVTDRDVILVDDMISTGGSIVKACEVLKMNRAAKVYAVCAHALLIGDALQRIKKAGVEEIIATNSIPGICGKVDLSPILSPAIRKIIHLHT
jgi:ribose-phosphate pyrophosphokinase